MPAEDDLLLRAAAANAAGDIAVSDALLDLDPAPTAETIAALNDRVYGHPASVARTLGSPDGLDACVALAGGGLIPRLVRRGRGRGCRTTSLVAARSGAPVSERLGYRDLGAVQMWERPAGR